MSAPQGVDVLAVMDAVAARIIRGDCAKVDELLNARAAVAEVYAQRDALAGLLKRAVESEGPFGSDRRPEWFNEACAAISRIGSAK